MQPRTRYECGEALHELQGLHDDLRGAVAVGCLELEHDLPRLSDRKALVGDGGSGDIPAQLLELMSLIDGAARLGMEAKAVRLNATLRTVGGHKDGYRR